MYCPKCGHKQWCACHVGLITKWIRILMYGKPWYWPNGDCIACGKCGLTRDASFWEDLEWDITREEREILNAKADL